MARRRRHKDDSPRHTKHFHKRDVLTVAIDPASMLVRALSPVLPTIEPTASLPDDWRNWEPDPIIRRPKTFSGSTPVIKQSRSATRYGYQDHFAAPQAVIQCVRRNQRKEVLHALGKAGKRGPKGRYRRTIWSDVKC